MAEGYDPKKYEPVRLGDVLPHDAENSPWLYRLLIIRDDLRFETAELTRARPGDDSSPQAMSESLWTRTYFIRRLAATLCEAVNVFRANVGPFVKMNSAEMPESVLEQEAEARALLEQAVVKLQVVRDKVAGHVRLSNNEPGTDGPAFERAALLSNEDWEGWAQISADDARQTTYQGLTLTAVKSATGTHDLESLNAWHRELRLLATCFAVMRAIDTLLFFETRRLVKMRGWVKKADQSPK